MQSNSMFMMLHPNANEFGTRNYLYRRPRDSQTDERHGSLSNGLENSPKNQAPCRQKRGKDSGHRAGDWICNVCNNHNYSFREVCNSCKTQTKIENLRQSLSVLTSDGPRVDSQKPTKQRKRLQLKSGEKFEQSLRASLSKPTIDIGMCLETPPPSQIIPATQRNLCQTFQDSFNEYPFEMDLAGTEAETGLDDEDSLELDKETLKILSFD